MNDQVRLNGTDLGDGTPYKGLTKITDTTTLIMAAKRIADEEKEKFAELRREAEDSILADVLGDDREVKRQRHFFE